MKTLVICFIIFIAFACKMKPKVDSNFFEQVLDIKFPEPYSVEEYYDNCENYVILKLKTETAEVERVIKEKKLKELDKRAFSFDCLGIERKEVFSGSFVLCEMNSFFEDSIVNRNRNYFYVDSCVNEGSNYYVLLTDLDNGLIWSIIRYPDWSGDKPCDYK